MVDVRIETKGFDEVAKKFGEFETRKELIIRDTLIEAANEFLNTLKFIAPRSHTTSQFLGVGKSGHYADSWGIRNITPNSVTIGTPLEELAIYLEYGTAPHPIVGHRKVLHWVDDEGDHFAMYVRHPGFPAIPHIRPAINVLEVKLPELVHKNLKKHLRIIS